MNLRKPVVSLSEKIKELFERFDKGLITIFEFEEALEKQDKEFIKDVERCCKKEFVEENVVLKAENINLKVLRIINYIKKRAGEELASPKGDKGSGK